MRRFVRHCTCGQPTRFVHSDFPLKISLLIAYHKLKLFYSQCISSYRRHRDKGAFTPFQGMRVHRANMPDWNSRNRESQSRGGYRELVGFLQDRETFLVPKLFSSSDKNTAVTSCGQEKGTALVSGTAKNSRIEIGAVVVKSDQFGAQHVPGVRLSRFLSMEQAQK